MLKLAQKQGYDSIVARFDNDVEHTVHAWPTAMTGNFSAWKTSW